MSKSNWVKPWIKPWAKAHHIAHEGVMDISLGDVIVTKVVDGLISVKTKRGSIYVGVNVQDLKQGWKQPATFNDYQNQSKETAIYPKGFTYPALGLSGEAGEVAEHIKKAIRDDDGKITPERKEKLKKELGDVLWYLSQLASEVGLSLDEIAQVNLDKLSKRQKEGKLQGSGSER